MTTEKEEFINRSALEKHAQTIIGALVLAGVLWMANTTQKLEVSVATLVVQIEVMKSELMVLRNQTNDQYSKKDAANDLAIRDNILRDHTDRIRDLEKEINDNKK